MGTLLTARNLPGIGDASPPDDIEPPECGNCEDGLVWSDHTGYVTCEDCNGTGYQPELEHEPGIEVDE